MSIKHLPLVFLSSLLLALLFLLIFPNSNIKAVGCSAGPKTYDANNPNKIQIQDGFLSVTTSDVINQMSLINDSDKFICGYKAIIPQFAIPTYQEFRNIYYDQAKPSVANQLKKLDYTASGDVNVTALPNLNLNSDILYRIKGGNLIINESIGAPKAIVFFVDGNLTINSNIDATSGVVFVVNGFIHVDPGVTNINALMMSYGQFCSGWWSGTCSINYFKDRIENGDENVSLKINGSVISLSSNGANKPAFVRYIRNNITPAEDVSYQSKYLVILRKIFSRTRIIWTVIN